MTDPGNARVLYLIRHSHATGQEPDAPLTPDGEDSARALAKSLAKSGIRRIVSSPFARARHTAAPLSECLGIEIETDHRLTERVLADLPLTNWQDSLRETFEDLDLRFEGGESSREATERGSAVLEDALRLGMLPAAIVSHGNLLALMLRRLDGGFGFEDWRKLSNPDVFRVEIFSPSRTPRISRIRPR